ncbi:MAG: tetratricopeptide repeat protein, partial [Planctomycetota bacterium]|nr:tetratricopeptide repeat protein [Planctomycetota bacterium]
WLEKVRQPGPEAAATEAEIMAQAEAAYEAEDYQKALALYNRALEINVDSAAALAGRGRCQAKLELWEEALASLREAAALAPEDSETWFVIGFVLRKLERHADAAEALEKFLALAPEDERAERVRAFIAQVRAPASAAPMAAEEKALSSEAAPPPREETPALGATPAAPPPLPPVAAEVPAPAAAAPGFAVKSAAPAESAATLTVEQRLAVIRDDLEKGDVNVALAKAQELVGQNPDCTAGKILIARCFGKKGEFAKAVVILENILGTEADNEEALFLLGRCQQEMGKLKEARATLERCRAIAKDEERKARLDEILKEFTASGKGICASCAESVPQSQLQEVNGRKICPNCRQRLESALGGQAAIMAAETPGEKAPEAAVKPPTAYRPQPQPAKSPLTTLALAAALLALIAAGTVVLLYQFSPATYEMLRQRLPAAWPLPHAATAAAPRPPASQPQPQGETATTVAAAPKAKEGEKAPAKDEPPFALEVPATATAVADLPFYLKVQAAEKMAGIKYTLEFSRAPAQAYAFDENSGELKWTPTAADCGEPIALVFGALCGERRAEAARCAVAVRPPPAIKALGIKMEASPGAAACLAAGDLNGDGQPELLAASGEFWLGRLVIYSPGANGYTEVGAINLDGTPLAMHVADFGRGRAAAIVDAWQNAIRFVAWQNGKFSLLSEKSALPERPALAAFGNPDGKGGEGVAVLAAQSRKIFVYDTGEEGLTLVREVALPASGLWKSLLLANFFAEAENSWQEIALIQAGQVQP